RRPLPRGWSPGFSRGREPAKAGTPTRRLNGPERSATLAADCPFSVESTMTLPVRIGLVCLVFLCATAAPAQEKPVVGLIPKAQKPVKMDGKLEGWDGAFVTPVHVG